MVDSWLQARRCGCSSAGLATVMVALAGVAGFALSSAGAEVGPRSVAADDWGASARLAEEASKNRQPNISLSGQSAGASMAIQHIFALSSSVVGAGLAAGSPYGCGALPGAQLPTGRCYYGGVDLNASLRYIQERSRRGLLDDLAHLQRIPIVLFNGKHDEEVYPRCMRDTMRQLQHFVDSDVLISNFETKAAHVWSLDHGYCNCGACADKDSRLPLCCDVNNCGFDLTGEILRRAYGPLRPRTKARQALHWIPQRPFLPKWARSLRATRMAFWGMAYVPSGCKSNPVSCRLHVHYHGCMAVKWHQRVLWVQNLDLNEYGEANDIVVLYPQAKGDHETGNGCWNWGFPDEDKWFDTKYGVQLTAVANMAARLAEALRLGTELPSHVGPPLGVDGAVDIDEVTDAAYAGDDGQGVAAATEFASADSNEVVDVGKPGAFAADREASDADPAGAAILPVASTGGVRDDGIALIV